MDHGKHVAKDPHSKHGNEETVEVSIHAEDNMQELVSTVGKTPHQNERSGASSKQLDENINTQLSRPMNCVIPFAYIPSKKCRDLANKKPIYDCKALTDSMME